MIWLLLIPYIFLPFIGLYTFSPIEEQYFGAVDETLKNYYLIHIFIILIIPLISRISRGSRNKNDIKPLGFFINEDSTFKNLIIVCITIIVFMFLFGTASILSGDVGRGEFRTTLGGIGFLYSLITLTLPASIAGMSATIYINSYNKEKIKSKLYLIYLLCICIGVLTGFKFTSILIISTALLAYSKEIKLRHLVIFTFLTCILVIFSAFYFMGLDYEIAIHYAFARATSVAVEGTVGVWNTFRDGCPDALYSLLYGFGNNIASFILNIPVNSPDFLKINMTRYIGYLTYPKYDEALSGAFNLTITNFGEAIYFFGQHYFFIFSVITGYLISFIINLLYKSLTIGRNPVSIALVCSYSATTFLPWLMNSGIANLLSLPNIFYYSASYFILRLCLRFKDDKDFNYNNNKAKDIKQLSAI